MPVRKERKLEKKVSHTKHGKLGNPNPVQTEEFRANQIKPVGKVPGDIPLGDKVIGVRLPVDVQDAIRALDQKERVTWLRSTLTNAARAELIESK